MSIISNVIACSIIFNVIACLAIYFLWLTIKEAAERLGRQHALINKLQQQNIMLANRLTNNPKLLFDQKTMSLIELSINNTNQDEARTAALIAVKSIYKKIK